MAGQLTTYSEKKILDHILKITPYTPPSPIYLGLSTADPGHTGSTWAEVTYGSYGRVPISFSAASARSIPQSGTLSFPQSSSGTVTVTYWGLWTLVSGGNLMGYGSLLTPKQIVTGNTPTIGSSQVSVSFDAGVFFTTFANTVLSWLFGGGTLPVPTNINIGLSTTAPQDDGSGITEPSALAGYARTTFNTWNAASGDPETATNNGVIMTPAATGSWGTVGYTVLYLDSTATYYANIQSQTVGAGDRIRWLNNGDYLIGVR